MAMDELKLTPEEAMQTLADLFSKGPRSCKSSWRTYIPKLENGELIFRRDEFCLDFDKALNEVFGPNPDDCGDDIVPQKLAKLFPGRPRHSAIR